MKKFIVFEGIDGSGSTTQTRLFGIRLYNADKLNHVMLTREPYDSQEIIRRLGEETDAICASPDCEVEGWSRIALQELKLLF